MAVITQTGFKLPLAVIENGGVTGNEWSNPNNILLVDGDVAVSNQGAGTASDITIGNFNFNIPENSVITGIEIKVIGYQGQQVSPVLTLSPVAVDNTSGSNEFYPYEPPFTGMTTSLATYILGSSTYLFATSWTVNQINNFKLNLQANGSISLDCVLVNVYYYTPDGTEPDPVEATCENCDTVIQAQPFTLLTPVTINDTFVYVKSFNLPNGIPITMDMAGECGGYIDIVLDQGKPKGNGNPFEENARVVSITPQPNGSIKLDFAVIENRGLDFVSPNAHSVDNLSEHNANSEIVISNNSPFMNRFVRLCQADSVFSPPITVSDDGSPKVTALHNLDFRGNGVQVTVGDDANHAIVTIPGAGGTTPPVIDSSSSSGSGATEVDELTWEHTCLGINRGLLVQIITEEEVTVDDVTYNGISLTQIISETDATNNLRTEQWILVAPTAGTNDIVVTLSGDAYITAGAVSLNGVDQDTPTGYSDSASGDSNSPSVVLGTLYDNSIVIDSLGTALTPILYTKGENQVENWHITANGNTRQGASSYQLAGDAPDSVTMEWSITQVTDWVMTVVEIKGITSSSSGGGGDIQLEVNQVAHGFSVGNLLRSSGTDNDYALALADTGANADIVGIVKEVIDADNFVITKDAYFSSITVPAGTPGSAVFLSATTPGLMTITPPATPGQIEKPVGIILASGLLMSFSTDIRGSVIGSGGGGGLVESVTGLNTNNSDPLNPVVQISVDGVSITGAGTPGSPLVAIGGGDSGSGGSGGTKIAIDTTTVTTSEFSSYETIYTVPIAGGILGNNNAIKFKILVSDLSLASLGIIGIKALYGGSEVTALLTLQSDFAGGTGASIIEGIIIADDAVDAQKSSLQMTWDHADDDTTPIVYGTSAVDSTVSQDLEIQAKFGAAGNTIVFSSIVVEKVTPSGLSGDIVIQDLLAGEPIAGATTPAAVFEGTNTIPTEMENKAHNELTFYYGSYDLVSRNSGFGSQIQLNPNRRATNFTTPSHTVTLNKFIIPGECNSNGTQSGYDFIVQIYSDSAGAPGSLLNEYTTTNVPVVNNEYSLVGCFPNNVTLSASTTYWIVVEWQRPNDPGNFANFYMDVANVGTGLRWNGSAWVSDSPFIFGMVLLPFKGYVYRSLQTSAERDERDAFLGFTTQTVNGDDEIDVIRDGITQGFTGLTVGSSYYVSNSVPGAILSTGTTKVAFATKTTEIAISRYTGFYQ